MHLRVGRKWSFDVMAYEIRTTAGKRPAWLTDRATDALGLTRRDHAIADGCALGLTNEQIGTALGLAAHTVKNNLQALLQKLEVANRASLVARLHDLGVMPRRPNPIFQSRTPARVAASPVMTRRELQVLDGVARGLSYGAVADELGLSLHTVKDHAVSAMDKLGAPCRANAVAKARSLRLLPGVESGRRGRSCRRPDSPLGAEG